MSTNGQAILLVVCLALAASAAHSSYRASLANIEASKATGAILEGLMRVIRENKSCADDPA